MPLGCFTVVLLFIVFVGSILVIVFSTMKSTAVYKKALARANADPAVIEALGSPIKDGFLVSGNTNVTARQVNPTWRFPSPVPGKRDNLRVGKQVTRGSGIIRGSSWNSDKRINASISSKNRCRPIHVNYPRPAWSGSDSAGFGAFWIARTRNAQLTSGQSPRDRNSAIEDEEENDEAQGTLDKTITLDSLRSASRTG